MERSVSETAVRGAAGSPTGPLAERRQRVRLGVQWRLQFRLSPETLLSLHTANLSSEGFYCVARQAIAAADYECLLRIPAHAPGDSRQILYLRCQVRVLRAEALGDQRFGIAARIRSYRAFTGSSKGV